MQISADDRKMLEIIRKPDYWSPRITRIAHSLGIPTSTAQSRLRKLERGGVFHGFGAVPAEEISGFACFLVGRAADPAEAAPKVLSVEGVEEVHAIAGESNLLVRFRAMDREDYFIKVRQIGGLCEVAFSSLSAKAFR